MEKAARQALIDVIRRFGRSVCDDPRRCEALLRDMSPQHGRAIRVLIGALKESIPQRLQDSSADGVPLAVKIPQLATHLHQELLLAEDAARWAVDSWTLALSLATPSQLNSITSSKGNLKWHAAAAWCHRRANWLTLKQHRLPASDAAYIHLIERIGALEQANKATAQDGITQKRRAAYRDLAGFTNYFDTIRRLFEERADKADSKASIFLDKGTRYSLFGIAFLFFVSLFGRFLLTSPGFKHTTFMAWFLVPCFLYLLNS